MKQSDFVKNVEFETRYSSCADMEAVLNRTKERFGPGRIRIISGRNQAKAYGGIVVKQSDLLKA